MTKKHYILIFVLITLATSVVGQSDAQKKISGYWSSCDGYTFKYLALKKDNSFDWYNGSCKGDYNLTGKYKQVGDTLILTDNKLDKELKVLIRYDKLFSYAGQDGQYPDFQPLIRTKKNTKKKAVKECQHRRKQVRKESNRRINKEAREEMKSENQN